LLFGIINNYNLFLTLHEELCCSRVTFTFYTIYILTSEDSSKGLGYLGDDPVELSSWKAGTAATGSYQLLFNLSQKFSFLTLFYMTCGLDSHALTFEKLNSKIICEN
jgi:hypothetical protein